MTRVVAASSMSPALAVSAVFTDASPLLALPVTDAPATPSCRARLNASLSASAVGCRSFGSLESARWSSVSTAGGSSGQRAASDGRSPCTMLYRMFGIASPSKGSSPVSMAYRITPRANTSVRPSMSSRLPRACSGLMKYGVPITTSAVVRFPCCPSTLEMPKSTTLTTSPPSTALLMKMFCGLRSRCTTPLPWAAVSADAVCSSSRSTSGSSRRPNRSSRVARSSPSSNSMTMNGRPSTV